MTARLSLVFVAFLTMAVAGCAAENMVRIAPAATADSLILLVGRADSSTAPSNTVYGLSVVRCSDGRAFWTIAADGSRLMPSRVVYGQPIAGFVVRTGPEPLTPGCYRAVVSIGHPITFDVTRTRQVIVRAAKS